MRTRPMSDGAESVPFAEARNGAGAQETHFADGVSSKNGSPAGAACSRGTETMAQRNGPHMSGTANRGGERAGALVAAPTLPSRAGGALGLTRRRRRLHGDTRGYMLRRYLLLADAAALVFAFLGVEVVGGLDGGPGQTLTSDLVLLAVGVPAWIVLLRAYGLYHVDSRRADHGMAEEIAPVFQMTALWCFGTLIIGSVTGLRSVPMLILMLFWALAFTFLLLFRAAVRSWAKRRTWYLQNTLVVGSPAEAAAIVAKILRHPEYGINIAACLELTGRSEAPEGAGVEESNVLGALGPVPVIQGEVDVREVVAELDVDRIVIGSSVESLGGRSTLPLDLSDLNVHLDVLPGWGEAMGSRLEMTELEGMPLLTLPRTEIARSSLVFKRLMDISVSAFLLVALAPLLLACAIAIKLESPGPVLFRQRRVGRGGRRFELLKFRSMYADAEARKEDVAELALHDGAHEHGIFKVARDPRVTRVGRMLRRLSLDELPQFFNILRGDMSLVGPRPLPEEEHERIEGHFRRRVDLMPGLTGLWQVHGRSDIPFDGMVDLDYLYVTNWSLWRDVKLLVRTVSVVVRGRGAY